MTIGDMYPAVLTIVLVGILLGVGLYVLSTFHNAITPDRTAIQGDINASAGSVTLTNAALSNFNLTSITSVINQTGATFTNYTFTGAGVITWGRDIQLRNTTDLLNVSYVYTYDADNTAELAITTTIAGLDDFATWIAIIVVVIAAAIVLGVVLSSFGRRRNLI